MGQHTRTGFEPTPAIVRATTDEDHEVEVLGTPQSSVSHSPGFGDHGRRTQVVEMECPADYCSFDRMVRLWHVNPEHRDTIRYWCLNPNCAHFVRDHLSHACQGNYPQRDVDEPAVSDRKA